jgi:hypothetical protein
LLRLGIGSKLLALYLRAQMAAWECQLYFALTISDLGSNRSLLSIAQAAPQMQIAEVAADVSKVVALP